jgi:predicted nucleotidyltransferase
MSIYKNLGNLERPIIELNEKLAENDLYLEFTIVGGYILEILNIRGTEDIDAFFITNDKLNKIIYDIGEKYHLNSKDELWLNNAVSNLNQVPPSDQIEVFKEYSNLTIKIITLEYLLFMKLYSGRRSDIKDIGLLLEYMQLNNIKEIVNILRNFSLKTPDISLILEGFESVYGIKWLEEFYLNNVEEIEKLM